jgi:hypothetical protein
MTNLIPPLQQEENYNDMLLVLPYKVAQVFCLHAGKEVRLLCIFVLMITTTNAFLVFFQLCKIKVSQLKFSTVTKGMYQGVEKVSFSHGNSDKTCKLSLTNYNLHESGTGENDMDIISDPNNYLCTLCLLKYHIQFNLPPNWKGFLFLCKASIEIIKLRKLLGITSDSTSLGKVGRSFLSKQVLQLAIMC